MNYINEDEYSKIIICDCDCGCDSQIKIRKIEGIDEYYLDVGISLFYTEQRGIFKTIIKRLKMIGYIILGKEYRFTEIVLRDKDVDSLIKNLKWVKEKKEKEILLESR